MNQHFALQTNPLANKDHQDFKKAFDESVMHILALQEQKMTA